MDLTKFNNNRDEYYDDGIEPDDNLTTCQFKALTYILHWYHTPNVYFCTLAGAAGTGKSFLSREILGKINSRTAVVSAPTHKALENVINASGRPGKTLHSLLGIAPDKDLENFDPIKNEFKAINEPKIKDYSLILLDEASMVNDSLREYLQDLAIEHGTKILYVGDKCQIPPVNEISSSVFDANNIDGGIVTLNTPVRQSVSNPYFPFLLADRSDIEQTPEAYRTLCDVLENQKLLTDELLLALGADVPNTYHTLRKFLKPHRTNEAGEGYAFTTNAAAFNDLLGTKHKQYFNNENYQGVRSLAYKNDTVKQYNDFIKGILRPNDNNIVAIGDFLMCYRPITTWDRTTRSAVTILNNSAEVIVKDIQRVVSEAGIEVYRTMLHSVNGKVKHVVDFVKPDDYNKYLYDFMKYKNEGIKRRQWKNFYDFYDKHLIMDNLAKRFDNKQYPDRSFDQAHALTVHKSQGSTYIETFVDMNDLLEYYNIQRNILHYQGEWNAETEAIHLRITRQLRYVASSRAKKFTYFLTS